MRNIKLKVDEYEYRLIVNALTELRKDEIEKGKKYYNR